VEVCVEFVRTVDVDVRVAVDVVTAVDVATEVEVEVVLILLTSITTDVVVIGKTDVVLIVVKEVMIDVSRIVPVVVVVPAGAINATADAIPTTIKMPMASTLASADIPNLPWFNERRAGNWERLCFFPD